MSSIESNLQTHNTTLTTTTTLHHTHWSIIIPRPFAPALAQTPAPSRRPSPAHHPTRSKTSIQDNNRLWHSVPSDGNLFSPFPLRHNIALLWALALALALALASIFAIAMSKRNDFYSSSRRLFQLSARARASINPIDSITVSATVSS
ncbi:uncharacterized protein CCOS01_05240 [Colletotrichum costaricense]|uniref:Uncharacterized protein n=1 Tax=Colletotrichum costaricense TaxID=1209916 RepID=A0AAI9Z196_9PEZI|nr:uncharacterized protein CCOS01_05240 [Colletotrichum costaricense]KAK1530137.1 hypothetical protein CCOS01_05240 [Colletotrichum costaricense]